MMAYMVLLILDDPTHLDKVLSALSEGGIGGATIIESTGLYRHQRKLIPMRYLYSSPQADEKDNVTILSIVDDKATAEKYLNLIETIVGDLDTPHTGVFAAWPLDLVKGVSSIDSSMGKQ
jgi:nitrogen regulatory protein P-II 1